MKQAIRALGWATTVLWILVILFSGTVVYSAMQIGMDFQGDPQIATSDGALLMSIPFSIINNGLYDISKLNITTIITDENETVISSSSTFIKKIQRGSTVNETHDIQVSLADILNKNLTYMLFNDTTLTLDMLVTLEYADTIPLKIISNQTMLWGAPLYNLTVTEISPVSLNQVNISLSFENHAFFLLNGTISLDLKDTDGAQVGSGSANVFAPPGDDYTIEIPVQMETLLSDPSDIAEVHLWFEMDFFSFGPVVIDLG
jgi:hypothetical protein